MAAKVDKAALLAAVGPKRVDHEIDGFGKVLLRQLSVAEVQKIRDTIKVQKEGEQSSQDTFGLRLVLLSVVNDDGTPVFAEDDLKSLHDASNVAMDDLVGKALEINGFRKKEGEKN